MIALAVLVFAVLFALPLLAGLIELRRPRDAQPLGVDRHYVSDPRYFGASLREKLQPLLDNGHGAAHHERYLERGGEFARIDREIRVSAGVRVTEALLATELLECDAGARVRDLFGGSAVRIGPEVRAQTILSDGDVVLGDGCRIERWIHSRGAISIGRDCDLGRSVSSDAAVSLAGDARFHRIFGMPVAVRATAAPDLRAPKLGRPKVVGEGEAVVGDLIVRGDLSIGARALVSGSIKVHGSLYVGQGAQIRGNVVVRRAAVLDDGVSVCGHVFCEGSLTLGRDVRIGSDAIHKSVYCGDRLALGDRSTVYGSIVVENGRRLHAYA